MLKEAMVPVPLHRAHCSSLFYTCKIIQHTSSLWCGLLHLERSSQWPYGSLALTLLCRLCPSDGSESSLEDGLHPVEVEKVACKAWKLQ